MRDLIIVTSQKVQNEAKCCFRVKISTLAFFVIFDLFKVFIELVLLKTLF